jgi:hypothetical protein
VKVTTPLKLPEYAANEHAKRTIISLKLRRFVASISKFCSAAFQGTRPAPRHDAPRNTTPISTAPSMATTVPDFAAIALQLETATAQIRALSSVPEAQREGKIMEAIEEVKNKVVGIEEQMKKIGSKLQSLEDTTNNRFVQVKAGSVFRSCVLHRLI